MHDVLILGRDHDDLAAMPTEGVSAAIRLFAARLAAVYDAGLHPVAFLNHGAPAGSSQPHPHAQVLGLTVPAPTLLAEATSLRRGRCVLCTAPRLAAGQGRMVATSGRMLAYTPYAPLVTGEVRIAPRDHEARLDQSSHLAELADILGRVLFLQRLVLGPHPYNLVLHSSPTVDGDFHWHIHVLPRQSAAVPSGLDGISPVLCDPVQTANELREAASALDRLQPAA